MRTSKTVSVSMPPAQLKQVRSLAKRENRTISELIREAVRQYQQKRETLNYDLIAALRAVQDDAQRVGLDNITEREVNAEIAAYRRERRQKS